jgi:bifunctional non-homologous end joining protein LigD
MGLREYQRKRNFTRTPEPKGSVRKSRGNSYLIQKHAARRLHYDLRLELDGVLLSWAVPKGPSLDPKERRLAVHVEDHPLDYGDFEGSIPKGEYGGGTVLLWDRGTWEPEGDPHEGLRRGDFKFRLHGEKLRGSWVLVRMGKPAAGDGEKENWLLIKHSDDESAPLSERDILQERPESVATGRGMEEIAAAYDREWTAQGETPKKELKAKLAAAGHSKEYSRKHRNPAKPSIVIDPAALPNVRKSAIPEKIHPELATLVSQVPQGNDWIHEIKFDGYRALCRIEKGHASFYTREGNDWTDRFGKLPEAAASLPVNNALLDGEVVVLLPNGSTSFQALQNSLGKGKEQPVYYVFDLLYLNGFDLRNVPLLRRKELLASLLGQDGAGLIRFSDHFQGSGEDLFKSACQYSLEGIISKRADRPYVQGRTNDWLKIKCLNSQEFVIGGFTEPAGARTGFGALLVGTKENGGLVYRGKVGTGYTDKTLKDLRFRFAKLEQEKSPFSNPPKGAAMRNVHWLKPELVAQVEFAAWTRDGILRHPSFQGLREDKKPSEIHRERPAEAPRGSNGPVSKKEPPEVAGVKISNPDRILYSDQGISKIELARYYEAVSDRALPHIQNRPLMFLRCPEGTEKQCFFQKHAADSVPETVNRIPIDEQGKDVTGLSIDSLRGLISLAQMGVLEIHSWGCRIDKMELPDLMIFDLDPDPSIGWQRVVDAAHEIRALLKHLGLTSFVKTTGGKGLHVEVPLVRRADWDEVKGFSKQIAETLTREYPDKYVAVMSKARRKGKIFVDYLRNGRGATAICPYSTRARAGAPVSVPIHWDELTPDLRPDQFNIRNLPQRLSSLKKDPWEGIEKARQLITAAMQKKLA